MTHEEFDDFAESHIQKINQGWSCCVCGQAGQAKTAAANYMQQMQDEYPGVQAPTPVEILKTDYGKDIANFMCFHFIFWFYSACTRQCFTKACT